MQYSTKPARINVKVKNHNNQIPPPYNARIHFLSTPNISNSGQLQINRKYINNMGNLNELSVFQYHRTTNMLVKNNNMEMNHYQNLRHQQHQSYIYKTPQYQNHVNPTIPVNLPMQRKISKDQTLPLDFTNKVSEESQNLHEKNKINDKAIKQNFRKLPMKTIYRKEEPYMRKEEAISSKQKDVPEKTPSDVDIVDCNKENSNADQREKVLNINNNLSEIDTTEGAYDKSTKTAREKTPMCLINDLARFNKISFQYRLTSENGPAHCKRFTVTLILGDEEYTAEGLKIKQAQHLAAKEAIENTKYKHPTPKINRRSDVNNAAKSNITPTVELNALAMKLGQQTYYIFDPHEIENNSSYKLLNQPIEQNKTITQQQPISTIENVVNKVQKFQNQNQKRQFLSKFHNRYTPFQHTQQNGSSPAPYTYFPSTSPCKITLIVGTKQFLGVGRTLQQAKHDAASNALKVLKEQIVNEQLDSQTENTEDNESKSPISLVFEIGIKRNLPVDFKVLREEGPAHMRTFVTACVVGDIVTEGEGTGKKISKKKAAQKMLEELKKLPPITPAASPVKRIKLKISSKKSGDEQSKTINSIELKGDTERTWHKNKKVFTESESTNPITRLLEWHQNNKEKEPEFKLINEFGKENSRRKQFIMEVSSNKVVARGVGNSKKLAKQDAAKNFLMAITGNNEQPATSENNNALQTSSEATKNVSETTRSSLDEATLHNKIQSTEQENNENATINTDPSTLKETTSTTISTSTKGQNLHMKDQLMYLAKILGFEVEFSDYPKGNHNEFLTIVMLSTTPPQICHGVGINANESQEDAAKNALKILSEMGLNNAVKS